MTLEQIKTIIQEKVEGVWIAEHDTSGHKYRNTKTGAIQRSVTTKLAILSKPHLNRWAIKMGIQWLQKGDRWQKLHHEAFAEEMMSGAQMAHLDIRDEAGGIGHIVHSAAERYINDWIASGTKPENIQSFAPINCDPRAIAGMRSVESFFIKEKIVPIASELLVGDDKYSAGTLDFLYFDKDGILTLGDFKTSNAIDQVSYAAQVAAYKYFWEKMTKIPIKRCTILHLSKDSDKFTVYKINKLPEAYKAFKKICGVYDWIFDNRDKIVKDVKKICI